MKTFEEYKSLINSATTEKELDQIKYEAFRDDPKPIDYNFLMGGRARTISDKVAIEVNKRKVQLGILTAEQTKRPTKAEFNSFLVEFGKLLDD